MAARRRPRRWSPEEDARLVRAVNAEPGLLLGEPPAEPAEGSAQGVGDPAERLWACVAAGMPRRSAAECKQRWTNKLDPSLVKGTWTHDEDARLCDLVAAHGTSNWSLIAERMPGRLGKQCRERWSNSLDPNIRKGPLSDEEKQILAAAHAELGNAWAQIAQRLPGRRDNQLKNFWNAAAQADERRKRRKRRQDRQRTAIQPLTLPPLERSNMGRPTALAVPATDALVVSAKPRPAAAAATWPLLPAQLPLPQWSQVSLASALPLSQQVQQLLLQQRQQQQQLEQQRRQLHQQQQQIHEQSAQIAEHHHQQQQLAHLQQRVPKIENTPPRDPSEGPAITDDFVGLEVDLLLREAWHTLDEAQI